MQTEIAKDEIEDKSQNDYKYQTTYHYESVSGKFKDIRVRVDIEEEIRKLAYSGVPAWKILERILRVINRHPEFREEILNENE
jgi:hypothetical protein